MATTNDWQETSRRVRGLILFAFAVALGLGLAWKLRTVLELVYVSALFAVVLMPMVQHIMGWKIRGWSPSRPVAIVVLVAGVFLGLTLFMVIALPPVLKDVQHFAQDLPQRAPELIAKLKQKVPIVNRIGVDSLAAKAESAAASFAQYIVGVAPELLGKVFDLVTAFILCLYFMMEGEFAYYFFLSLFREPARDRLAKTLQKAELRMSKWLIGQGLLMLILGVASTIVFGALHVRYFVLLGVLMGLFNIIPIAGGVITIVMAAGVAAMDSWGKMAGVLIFYLIYTQVETGYLTPRIMRSSVNLMGLTVLVALLAGSELAGIVGALVAVPTAALVAVLAEEYLVQTPDMTEEQG